MSSGQCHFLIVLAATRVYVDHCAPIAVTFLAIRLYTVQLFVVFLKYSIIVVLLVSLV